MEATPRMEQVVVEEKDGVGFVWDKNIVYWNFTGDVENIFLSSLRGKELYYRLRKNIRLIIHTTSR